MRRLPDVHLGRELEECSYCGRVGFYDVNRTGIDGGIRHRWEWTDVIFEYRHKPDVICQIICDACAAVLLPDVWKLRDIQELRRYVNKLERSIHEVTGRKAKKG